MRIRDIIIVGVAIVCSIVCWSQEGTLNFQRGFKIPVRDHELTSTLMPKPVVVDPDGSGSRILLATTELGRLSKFKTHYARRRVDDSFVSLAPVDTLDLQSPIMAIGAGYTNPQSRSMMGAVITEDYQLLAVNITSERLKVLWKAEIVMPTFWEDAVQASISIIPEKLWIGDVGTVAVAVNVMDPTKAKMTLYAAFNADNGELRWRYFSDGGNEMDDMVRMAAVNKSNLLGLEDAQPVAPVTQDTVDDERDIKFHGRTYVQPWTTFREGVIAALPHRYAHPWDTQLLPHVIHQVKNKGKTQRKVRKGAKGMTLRYNDRVVHMGTDDYGALGEKLTSWMRSVSSKAKLSSTKNVTRRRRTPNVFMYHGKNGVEVVHVYTGNIVASVGPLRSDGTAYHDINDDLLIESVSTQIGPRTAVHSKHGVDILYDCLGMIEGGVPTASAVELFNATVCDTQGFFGNLDLIHHFIDGDVRGEEAPHAVNTLELLGSRNVASSTTQGTPPLVVQVQNSRGGGVYQVERYAVFMINTGLVTCVDPSRRRVLWRTQTGSRFSPSELEERAGWNVHGELDELESKPFPQLVAYSLSQRSRDTDVTFIGGGKEPFRRVDTYVLAVGDSEFSVLKSKNGKVTRTVGLAEPPVAPVLVVDFNGDGTNDLIVVSRHGIYGYVGNSQATSETIAALMLLLVGLLGILFAIREKNIAEGDEEAYTLPVHAGDKVQRAKTFKRSTD